MTTRILTLGGTNFIAEGLTAADLNDTFTELAEQVGGSASPIGHVHDGVDSRAVGWILHETKDFSAAGTASVSFVDLPNKRSWKIVFWAITDFSGAGDLNSDMGLRINADSGNNYSFKVVDSAVVAWNTSQTHVGCGFLTFSIGDGERNASIGSFILHNQKGLPNWERSPVAGVGRGSTREFSGGHWDSSATTEIITLFTVTASRNFKGIASLYFLEDIND